MVAARDVAKERQDEYRIKEFPLVPDFLDADSGLYDELGNLLSNFDYLAGLGLISPESIVGIANGVLFEEYEIVMMVVYSQPGARISQSWNSLQYESVYYHCFYEGSAFSDRNHLIRERIFFSKDWAHRLPTLAAPDFVYWERLWWPGGDMRYERIGWDSPAIQARNKATLQTLESLRERAHLLSRLLTDTEYPRLRAHFFDAVREYVDRYPLDGELEIKKLIPLISPSAKIRSRPSAYRLFDKHPGLRDEFVAYFQSLKALD